MDVAASFGEALRDHRQARLLTQANLAERAGLSERAVSDLERGLKRPQRATVRLLIDALGLTPDAAEAFGVAARVRLRPAEVGAPDADTHKLPMALTSFVGREDAIAKLQRQLDPHAPTHLVTLTGVGGCGKTRLAIEVAHRLSTEFPHGVWFADLSSIADAALVPNVVLTAIEGREWPDRTPLESVLRHLRGRRLLLVLDNCEHLIGACAELLDKLLSTCPSFRVLATSREALRVPGEVVVRVPSLTVPELADPVDADLLLHFEAVRLFVERARQADSEFSIEASSSAAVADICRRLDGIPLAIELAAARVAVMSVQEIAVRLDDCFDMLTSGYRTASARHRTLRATIDWSHDLLSITEQTLFRRLAVFVGGWTLDAAEAVCEGEPLVASEIMDTLMRLIDQSLVSVRSEDGRTRYRFLETVRAYAAERLEAAGEASATRVRHRDWCLAFAERAVEGWTGPEQSTWFRRLAAEHDNVRAALDCCAVDPTAAEIQLRLAAAMGQFWFPRHSGEGRRRLAAALGRADATPRPARVAALSVQAQFELLQGDPAIGREMARQLLLDARAVGDARQEAEALLALALATHEDETAARLAFLEEGLAVARAAGVNGLAARQLGLLGAVAAEAGDLRRARMLLNESVSMSSAASDPWILLTTTVQFGWLAVAEGSLDEAESHFQRLIDREARWGGRNFTPALSDSAL